MEGYLEILAGFGLDLWIGDPKSMPHPVRWIGATAHYLEVITRRKISNPFAAGVTTTALVMAGIVSIVGGFLLILEAVHPFLNFMGSIYLAYTCIAARSLYDESRPVALALQNGRAEEARKHLTQIVGRDTDPLDESGMIRATVETVAENTIDGVVAPLFYLCIGGPVAGLVYKGINTLDSLFGYRNSVYEKFGKFPARLDDAANWLPARLGGALMVVSCWCCSPGTGRPGSILLRDWRHHASPNAGIPEAVMAGYLGIRLGGPAYYQGIWIDKPYIGDSVRDVEINDIRLSHQVMWMTSVLALAAFILITKWDGLKIPAL